jgi:hypothetical protein
MENVTNFSQPSNGDDLLTWPAGTAGFSMLDTTLGLDAGGLVLKGYNESPTASTSITTRTVSTTGTAQAGVGILFIIEPPSTSTIYDESISLSAVYQVASTLSLTMDPTASIS